MWVVAQALKGGPTSFAIFFLHINTVENKRKIEGEKEQAGEKERWEKQEYVEENVWNICKFCNIVFLLIESLFKYYLI